MQNATVTLTQEQYSHLDKIAPDLHSVIQSLENTAHPKIIKTLKTIQKNLDVALKDIRKEENDSFDKEYKKLSDIAQKHKFTSVWSMSEVKTDQMGSLMPFKMKKLTYESWGPTQEVEFKDGNTLTWFEAWQECEKLIRLSTDTHHVFVESIYEDKKNPGCYFLSCGS